MKTKLLNIRIIIVTLFINVSFVVCSQEFDNLVTQFKTAFLNKQHEQAIKYGEQLNEMFDDNNTPDSIRGYIKGLLSIEYYTSGDHKKSVELETETKNILKGVFGLEHPDYATTLTELAGLYYEYGNYSGAIRLETEAMEIRKKVLGAEHQDYAQSLNKLALYYSHIGNYAEAIRLGTQAMEIRKRVLRTEHPDYATSLNNLAGYYSETGNYAEAIRLGTQAMEITKKALGIEHPNYAQSLSNLALYYSNTGNYAEAIRLGTQAMEIRKKTLGMEHPDYALSLNNLADYYSQIGNYTEAIRLGTQAMEIRKKALGTEHPNYAQSLNNLALYYSNTGNYAEAIRLGTQAMEIRKKALGMEHSDYAQSLSNLASYYSQIGNYAEAIRLGTQAMEIAKKALGMEHPDYAQSLNNLASYYSNTGNYAEAIRLGTQAMEIRKKALGTEHPDYAQSLSNLASYYSQIGNYAEAIRFETQAMEIRKKTLGMEHPDYALSLHNLAFYYYYHTGNYAEAIRLETQAMEIAKKELGMEHPNYALSLHNLAFYYSQIGNYTEAIRLGTQAMEIRKKALGIEHPDYALSLNDLAGYYSVTGNYAEAIRLGTQTMEITKKALGTEHPNYALSLSNLASYYSYIGNYAESFSHISEASNIYQSNLLSQFSSMTNNQRQHYWSTKEFSFLLLPGYAMRSGRPESASIVYDKSCLFAKGLLLSAETGMREVILESGDEQALRKFEELQEMRAWLGKLYETPIAERQMSTDSLERVAERQEAELVQMSAAYGDFMRNLKLTWKDVQAKLGDKDIAIEFLSFPLMYTDSTMYIALTLKKSYDNPRMIPLFELQQLKDIKTSYYKSPELSTMLWGKLADELEGVQNVYFSPSGELYNIGIESMPDFNGSGSLLNERFNFYRLSSTRELATTKRDAKEASGATIYGGINYNTDVAHMGTPHKEESQIYAFNRGFDADSAGLRGSQIGSLAGTLEESNKIDSILTAAHVQVDKLTGDNATETSLKNMSGKHKRIMHIATHGFYWSESEAEKTNTQKQLKFLMLDNENNQRYMEDKAMTRSGLLFCGAQNTFNGDAIPEGVDDGVLTAQEISQIDLRGLDLLVLSACQTGLGEISGDGVFGLQRGFKKAGAQTIVMSLWKVNDAATRDLMVQFYTGLADGLTKRQAFLKAQKYLKDHDKTYPYTYKMRNNPHWAAFILLDALQ